MKRQWYEKYIGYCFNDNGREVILDDVYEYEDGRKCYQLHYPDTGECFITGYREFMKIRKQTNLPQ